MLTTDQRQAIRALVDREVVPAMGCTEPVAVALAAARARELLATVTDRPVSGVDARLSGNIIKNAMGVGIPGTGMTGLPIAIALGATMGSSARRLEVLAGATARQVAAARSSLVDTGAISIRPADDADDILYIDVTVRADDGHSARAVISHEHANIVVEETDGLRTGPAARAARKSGDATAAPEVSLDMAVVWDYAMNSPLDELTYILEARRLNEEASRVALNGGYGHQVGHTLLHGHYRHIFGDTAFTRVLGRTAAGCDARMGGAAVTVMSNSGSGNQGIAATMPVVAFADECGADTEHTVRALVLSHLTVIYIKQSLGRLSALCGCVVAATGSAAAITYLMGGTYGHAVAAVKNMVANLTGMICDGAKPSCALKLASGVSTAVISAIMAMDDHTVTSLEGIVDDDVDRTIANLTSIGRDAMTQTDTAILDIMTSKR